MIEKPKVPLLICLLFIFGLLLAYSSLLAIKIDSTNLDTLVVENNTSASDVAKILSDNGCVNSSLFKAGIILTFSQKQIKPGRYSLKGINNLQELLRLITSINKDRTKFTIIEGWTAEIIAEKLENKLNIDKNRFIHLCKNQSFIYSQGLSNYNSLEGLLFPDTYWLLNTYSEEDMIMLFVNRFKDIYKNKIFSKIKNSNLNTQEIVTLASIIQSEAMYKDEMPIISSVYHNRLKKNMKLEADPTVLYFMNKYDKEKFRTNRKIFRKYKDKKNPYNTYVNKGLPIGPINNPGLDAMLSAIDPVDTNITLLYFVADGKGRHIFTESLKNHKKAINKVRYGY